MLTAILSLASAPASASLAARARASTRGMEGIIEAAEFDEVAVERAPLTTSAVDPISLRVHWRLYKQVLSAGGAGADELEALREGLTSAGERNEPARAFAAIQLVEQHHREGTLDAGGRREPEGGDGAGPAAAARAHGPARLLLTEDPTQVGAIVRDLVEGWRASFSWPDTSIPYRFNAALLGLLAGLGASLAFLLAQLLRQFGGALL